MEDADFLKFMLDDATKAEIESFKERVGIMMHDGKLNEDLARQLAFTEILNKRKNNNA